MTQGRHKDAERIFKCDRCGKLRGHNRLCLECSGVNPDFIWLLQDFSFNIDNLTLAVCLDCCNCEDD